MKATGTAFGLAAITLMLLSQSSPASAAHRTFVASSGDDANPCTRLQPCRTFAHALTQTDAGGEIDAIDTGAGDGPPGGFGPVTITKSVTIDGGASRAGILGLNNGIVIDVSPTARVTLRNLSLDGKAFATNGISITEGSLLRIENCIIANFSGWGIAVRPHANLDMTVHVSNTTVIGNGFSGNTLSSDGGGIKIAPQAAAWVRVFLDGVRVANNRDGIFADGSQFGNQPGYFIKLVAQDTASVGNSMSGFTATSTATVSPTQVFLERVLAAENGDAGVRANGAASGVIVGNSTIWLNQVGVASVNQGGIGTYKNNQINGNGTNGTPLPPAGTLTLN
jgi:hypothetical protein